jgi:diguanylate cyclase (GGDEF)-like protein/PAS domain S-box-containing protein
MPSNRLRMLLPASSVVALLLGLLATSVLVASRGEFEQRKIEAQFATDAGERIAAVRGGLTETVETLTTITLLFGIVPNLERTQFRQFSAALIAHQPQVRLVNYQRMVGGAERAAFEAQRQPQFPGFAITELADGKIVRAGPHAHYRVIDYLEPLAGNESLFGLDAFSRKEQDEAMQRACRSGQPAMTGLYQVLFGRTLEPGLVVLMPVSRTGAAPATGEGACPQVIGYTSAALASRELVQNSLAARRLKIQDFDISVYADRGSNEGALAFRANAASGQASHLLDRLFGQRAYRVAQSFEVAGQPWHVVVSAPPRPLLPSRLGSLLMLACGILTSLLVAAYMRALAIRAHKVNLLVADRTAALLEANQALQLREQAIEACINSIIITSAAAPDYPIEYVNPAFERITGFTAAEVLGRSCSLLWREDSTQAGVRELLKRARALEPGQAVLRTYHKDGSLAWSETYLAPIRAGAGAVEHFVLSTYDITLKKRYEQELEYQANFDALTGLANRKLLLERLRQSVEMAERTGRSVWVMFVDLDRFKFVNESLGHGAGDQFLKMMAARLGAAVREGDTVARHGGDEFVLLLPEGPDGPLDPGFVSAMIDAIARPVEIEGHEFFIGCNAGIATYPADAADPVALIEFADLAMYSAKQVGRNNFQFYTREMNDRAQERLRVEGALRTALENDEFELFYQPQVDLTSGQVVGVEALLRWRHPQLGTMAPSRFITVAEDTALIVPIGEWVLRTACAQGQAWRAAGMGELRVAVNLSLRQFSEAGLVEMVAATLGASGLPPHCLYIELTEALLMDDPERAVTILGRLRALGVRLSVDDFGTGYSSLAYLKRFPIDLLKIDQSFVSQIAQPSDAGISDAIISMAHSMGIRVIAEGVESEAQCEFLARSMCDEMQGFLYSEALAAPAMEQLLRQGRQLPQHLLRMHKRAGTLLLVDDEPNILAALKRQLRGAGCEILTADSGQAGLELLLRHKVDVIVSDQRMPGMTGVEFLRTVKTLYPKTVRIVLSGFTELQSVTDAVNEGAIYKFLTKPWDDAQLREHVREAFAHKDMADENRHLDLQVRTANFELAQANRQLEDLLQVQQERIQQDGIMLEIVREALQHVPSPIIGLDDDDLVVFANLAAQALLGHAGLVLGGAADLFMPAALAALRQAGDGVSCSAQFDGADYDLVARSMGKDTPARGTLITFTASARAALLDGQSGAPLRAGNQYG